MYENIIYNWPLIVLLIISILVMLYAVSLFSMYKLKQKKGKSLCSGFAAALFLIDTAYIAVYCFYVWTSRYADPNEGLGIMSLPSPIIIVTQIIFLGIQYRDLKSE